MQHKYFGASNSAHGFINYFGQLFERADFIYIIKGGPGTGKSSFMKRLAIEAEKRGDTVEYYYCSSDTDSVDGVLIFGKERILGFIDGTSPHVREPELAGVCDEIINLASFWDRKLLLAQKNEIKSLSMKKSVAYSKAYDYLRSCGNLQTVIDSILEKTVDNRKMLSAVERFTAAFNFPSGEARVLPLSLEAVAMNGMKRLDSFEKNCEILYTVSDFYGAGKIFLCKLLSTLKTKELSLRVSYDAVCPWLINGIYIDREGIAIILFNGEDERSEKVINSKRFVNQEDFRKLRNELRYAKKLYESSLDGALHALGEAKIYHFLLEDIYKNAMDFNALSDYSKSFKA